MKKEIIKFGSLCLCCLLIILSCQKEELILNDGSEEEVLPKALSEMVMKVVIHDGSYDDVVDGGNCFSIDIPYAIELNGEEKIISSRNDYASIQTSDQISIKFPIMVTTYNHKSKVVKSESELLALASICLADDEDIECVDFVYPFTFNVFDEARNRFKTVEVFHDRQIYEFMTSLDEKTIVAINYPIDLALYDGRNEEAGHNEALMATIIKVINVCDENDN